MTDQLQIMDDLLEMAAKGAPGDAAAYAGMTKEEKPRLVALWMQVMEENAWLVPEPILKMGKDVFTDYVTMSAGYFVLGYMLARREMEEAPEA